MAKKSALKLVVGTAGFSTSGCDATRGVGFISIAAGLIGEICCGLGGVIFFTVVILVEASLDMMTASKSPPTPSSATTIFLTGVLSIIGSGACAVTSVFVAVIVSGFGGVFSFDAALFIFGMRGTSSS